MDCSIKIILTLIITEIAGCRFDFFNSIQNKKKKKKINVKLKRKIRYIVFFYLLFIIQIY